MLRSGGGCCVEGLQSRLYFDAPPYEITPLGERLLVQGTVADDTIRILPGDGGLIVADDAGNQTLVPGQFGRVDVHGGDGNDYIIVDRAIVAATRLYGDAGDDTIMGGGGQDMIFTGTGGGFFRGRNGNDTLVSIDDPDVVTLQSDNGYDMVWYTQRTGQTVTGVSDTEAAGGAVHVINAFVSVDGTAATIAGRDEQIPNLVDPVMDNAAYTYADFSGMPLFPVTGPGRDDINQGGVGDCYMLAALSSVAGTTPRVIRQAITEVGDGTYVVRFKWSTLDMYYRIDADLPTWNGHLAYARQGREGSLWVALLEKAYAFQRFADGKYASLSGGWMSEIYGALGEGVVAIGSATDGVSLLNQTQDLLLSGKAVTVGILNPNGAPLIGSHAYTVIRVVYDESGVPIGVVLRNPWGFDGAGDDGANDGYVTVSADQLFKAFWQMQAGVR